MGHCLKWLLRWVEGFYFLWCLPPKWGGLWWLEVEKEREIKAGASFKGPWVSERRWKSSNRRSKRLKRRDDGVGKVGEKAPPTPLLYIYICCHSKALSLPNTCLPSCILIIHSNYRMDNAFFFPPRIPWSLTFESAKWRDFYFRPTFVFYFLLLENTI